jgi:trehalose 6-phosphate phosphatase
MNFADLVSPSTALFLDFDGTLVDLAEQPHLVVVPAGLVKTLGALAGHLGGAMAVVSGRPIGQLDDFLRPLQFPAAGVHGAERRRADGETTLLATEPLDDVERAARALAAQHAGLLVETKRGSVALHYRQAPELEALCLATLQAAAESPGLALLHGKMVIEVKPAGVNKGRAIEDFMREAPFAGRTPLFVGDDVTDEAGFTSVQGLGGVGVKIGPGATLATHRINGPQQFRDQLGELVAARTGQAGA